MRPRNPESPGQNRGWLHGGHRVSLVFSQIRNDARRSPRSDEGDEFGSIWQSILHAGVRVVVKLRVRSGESIQDAVRRFRKLCERSGLRKEMRRKAYYEKP